jgi:hypothetical protein
MKLWVSGWGEIEAKTVELATYFFSRVRNRPGFCRAANIRPKRCLETLVRLAGLEPAIRVFSVLLIVAFLCGCLLVLIRHYTRICKHYFASTSDIEQKIVCESVRALPVVREVCGQVMCAGSVRGGNRSFPPIPTNRILSTLGDSRSNAGLWLA